MTAPWPPAGEQGPPSWAAPGYGQPPAYGPPAGAGPGHPPGPGYPPGYPTGQPPGSPTGPGNPPGSPTGPGYPPGYGPPPAPGGRPGLAVAALVTGLIPITSVLGIVFGFVGRSQARRRGQRGATMATVGIVAGALWVAVLVTAGVLGALDDPERDGDGRVTASGRSDLEDLRVGDCVRDFDGLDEEESIGALDLVPCATVHQGEVFALFELPDGDYPGELAVTDGSDEGCSARFEAYVDSDVDDSELDVTFLYPDRASWRLDDREVICVLAGEDLLGSVKGSGR